MKFYLTIKRKKCVWFAWYPVKLQDDRFVWFENVIRTPIYADGFFQYFIYEEFTKTKE